MLPPRVLVVGGGIAGLACAIALRAHDFPVDVVELSGQVEPDTVTLTGRSIDALADLGVLTECRARGQARATPTFGSTFDEAGQPLDLGRPQEPHSTLPASVVLFRPVLIDVLGDAARKAGARVRVPCTVAAVEQFAESVFVSFSDGGTGEYGIVVAADGVHSGTRDLVWGNAITPCATGAVGVRWTAAGLPPGDPGFYYAGDKIVAIGKLPGDVTYVSAFAEASRMEAVPDGRALLRGVLDLYTAPYLRALRDRLDDTQRVVVKPWEWLWMPKWRHGRVVLIGDAAHATTHYLPAGAGLALIDGVVLAEELSEAQNATAGLMAFEDRRWERARLVVRTSVDVMRLRRHGEYDEMRKVMGEALRALVSPY